MLNLLLKNGIEMEYEELLKDKWDIIISKIDEVNDNINQLIEEFGEKYIICPEFAYYLLIRILKDWVDVEENYYDILANWILGSYFIDYFVSYPYLYINAVKRSGKTRLLKLISTLSYNGVYTSDMTEAVLFRMPSIKQCTLTIDEAENIGSKEKKALRLLLNSAYKKGMKIYRARKIPKSEKYVVDEFEIFMPIAIANIYGIDDVLEDRCITIILERSNNISIITKPEYFELDFKFSVFKYVIERIVSVGSVCQLVKKQYNNLLLLKSIILTDEHRDKQAFDTTNITNITDTTNTNSNLEEIIKGFLRENIIGRDFECWYPIFIINSLFNQQNFRIMLSFVSKIVKERRTVDIMEDRDTSVLIFLGNFIADKNQEDFFSLSMLSRQYTELERKKTTSEGMTKILKRLKVVIERRRVSRGREMRFDFDKINLKMKQMGIEPKPFETKEVQQSLDFSNELDQKVLEEEGESE